MLSKYINLAIEDLVNTTSQLEREIVIYGKIEDKTNLSKVTTKSKHHQVQGRFMGGQRCRVRKTTQTVNDTHVTDYTFTFKIRNDTLNYQSSMEYNATVDKDFLLGFNKVADSVITKNRYTFNSSEVTLTLGTGEDTTDIIIPSVVYEVDVFVDNEGKESNWCKVDIEVDSVLDYLSLNYPDIDTVKFTIGLSNLPIDIIDPIVDMNPTDEEREMIDNIWDKYTYPPSTDD